MSDCLPMPKARFISSWPMPASFMSYTEHTMGREIVITTLSQTMIASRNNATHSIQVIVEHTSLIFQRSSNTLTVAHLTTQSIKHVKLERRGPMEMVFLSNN